MKSKLSDFFKCSRYEGEKPELTDNSTCITIQGSICCDTLSALFGRGFQHICSVEKKNYTRNISRKSNLSEALSHCFIEPSSMQIVKCAQVCSYFFAEKKFLTFFFQK